jgi:hypothetical protein
MTAEARWTDAKIRALDMVEADRPVEAITTMTHALHHVRGLDYPDIAERLAALGDHPGVDGLRDWIEALE